MLFIKVVSRFVQQQNVRFFQEQFAEENFCPLASRQFGDVPLDADIGQSQGSGDFLHLGVDQIEIVDCEHILYDAQFLQIGFHLRLVRF